MKIHEGHPNENKQRQFIQNALWHKSQPPSLALDRDPNAGFIVENGRFQVAVVGGGWPVKTGGKPSMRLIWEVSLAFSGWS